MNARPVFLSIAATVALVSPASAAPGDRIIACDPPLDRPLRLVLTQHFYLADGKAASATITRRLRFSRTPDGLTVAAHIAALDTDEGEPDAQDRLRMAYGAPGDVPIQLHLDPAMVITRIDSLAWLWQDFHRRQVALAVAMGKRGGSNERAQTMTKILDAMSAEDRIAVLSSFLKPVLRHCGTVAPSSAQWLADGTIAAEISADVGDTRDVSRYRIDARTGMMRSLERVVTSAAAPLRPMRELWTLDFEP